MTTKEDLASVLDRLVNIMLTSKEIKPRLLKQGESMAEQCLEWRYSAAATRLHISTNLTEWMKKSGWYGHGTKKLVDKAVSKLMSNYKHSLHSALAADRREEKREAKWQAERWR